MIKISHINSLPPAFWGPCSKPTPSAVSLCPIRIPHPRNSGNLSTRSISQSGFDISVATKRGPASTYKIEVLYHQKHGLQAFVYFLDLKTKKECVNGPLPFKGLPKKVLQIRNIELLKRYFASTHLLPKKKPQGCYYCISVGVSGLGGMIKARIPVMPGLGLGSIVKSDNLVQLEKFDQVVTEQEMWLAQLKNAERKISQLEKKENGKDHKTISKVWEGQLSMYKNLVNELEAKLISVQMPPLPVFKGFQQGLKSPIDFDKTSITVRPSHYDSSQFNSQYISMKTDLSHIEQTLINLGIGADLSGKVGWDHFLGASLSAGFGSAISSRIAEIKEMGRAEGVLVINATVTTRNVRSLSTVHYDKNVLEILLNVMKRDNDPEMELHAITKDENGKKSILILTEAFLGGSFTGIVTQLAQDNFRKHTSSNIIDNQFHVGGGGGLTTGGILDGNLNLSVSGQMGIQSDNERMKEIASTNIQIEILAQGAIPSYAQDVIKQGVANHLNLDPSLFSLIPEEEDLISSLNNGSPLQQQTALNRLRVRMMSTQQAIQHTVQKALPVGEQQSVHSLKSLTGAYESFNKQITSDKDCGVPISFNYQILTESQIEEELLKLSREEFQRPAV